MLAQQLGRGAVVWRDANLTGNTDFGGKLDDEVPRSAAIVSIVSKRYVESAWCLREVEGFVGLADQDIGSTVANMGRVFPVLINHIPEFSLPTVFRRFLGYRFFKTDEASGRVRRLDRRFGREYEEAYYAVLNDLAEDLGRVLPRVQAPTTATAVDEGQRSVYIAPTTEGLWSARDALARELSGRGHRVLPDGPLPAPGTGPYDAAVESYLQRAELAIHFVGDASTDDPALKGVEVQARIAARVGITSPLANLFWIEPEIDLAQPRGDGAPFVRWLRDEAARGQRVDLLQTNLQELTSVAREALESKHRGIGSLTGDEPVVWIAETTSDQREAQASLINALALNGLPARTTEGVPYTPDYGNTVEQMVTDAHFAVQIVGDRYGVVPESREQSIQELQLDAVHRAGSSIQQVVWWRAGAPEDPRQQSFLDRLRVAADSKQAVHLVEAVDPHEVAAHIDVMRRKHRETSQTTGVVSEGNAVYVVFDESDYDNVEPLLDALFDAGIEELKPLLDGTPEEVRAQHEDNLRDAAALILFHGQAGERWLNVQVRELKRAPALRSGRELPAMILLGPPEDRHKKRFRARGAEVVHAEGGIDPAALDGFISSVGS